jgi:hypothetical protein
MQRSVLVVATDRSALQMMEFAELPGEGDDVALPPGELLVAGCAMAHSATNKPHSAAYGMMVAVLRPRGTRL